MELLGTAYAFLLQLVLDRRGRELFDQLSLFVAKQIYQGYGFDLATHMARQALAPINALATGTIRLKLYKGRAEFEAADDVPHQMYSESNASMEAIGEFDHADSEGFLRVLQVSARRWPRTGRSSPPRGRRRRLSTKSEVRNPKGTLWFGSRLSCFGFRIDVVCGISSRHTRLSASNPATFASGWGRLPSCQDRSTRSTAGILCWPRSPRELGVPVHFELSVTNADKPELPRDEVERRLAQFTGVAPVWLTRAATFEAKAALFPGAAFVLGWDTAVRVIDPKYYGGEGGRDAALRKLLDCGCKMVVGGRLDTDGSFRVWDGGKVAVPFAELFVPLTEADFRVDVSSTELREKT